MSGFVNISEAMSIAVHTSVWLGTPEVGRVSVGEIARRFGFSANHLAKVARQLVRAGILTSERGPSGGLTLARSPASITLLELHAATGGDATSQGCLLRREFCDGGGCLLGKALAAENKRLVDLFRRTTLADVAKTFTLKTRPSGRGGKD